MNPMLQVETQNRITLRGLPVAVRMVFTLYLLTIGLGYLLALFYLFLADIEPHRKMGIGMVQATIIKYYGKRDETKLEAAVKGRMGENISEVEREEIIRWIHDGVKEETFVKVQPIFLNNCAPCHSSDSGLSVAPLTNYTEVSSYVGIDLGQSIKSLTRISHIHLFGISFIFIHTGLIFSFSEIRKGLRLVILALPFLAMWTDIFSWWFTKYQPIFAYTVIIGGALMGIALAAQILISLYEMWTNGRYPDTPQRAGL
jgi:hypothetical protein